MQAKSTDVAVIIPAFNSATTIGRAVRSALEQAETAECIVVDDASQDGTASAAREADDGTGRLHIIHLAENVGPSGARNSAIDVCRSDLICILDGDDYLVGNRLGRLLESAPEFDFIADNILIIPEEADAAHDISRRAAQFEQARRERPLKLDLERFVLGNIPRRGHPRSELGFLKPIMRKAFLKTHGLRYQPQLRLGEDYALYVEALIAGARFYVRGPCGYVAVERASSLSSVHSARDLSNLADFERKCLADHRLSANERDALRLHLRSVDANAAFRHALQARAQGGLAAGVAHALRRPSQLGYMVSETFRAKWRLAGAKYAPRTEVRTERFLVNDGFWRDSEIGRPS
jgi:succinoglycan biosynthesis protein ExoU